MSGIKSIRELREVLAEATDIVAHGSTWRHYKGGVYTVLHLAFDEVTLNIEVIYSPVNAPDILFARELSVWLETVIWQDATLPRFEHIAG